MAAPKTTAPHNTINVLMCGGRRTGKTSIMASMRADMQKIFADGSIRMDMQNTYKLILFQNDQEQLFSTDNWEQTSYYADDSPTGESEEFPCEVTFRGDFKSPVKLNFIDIPGEWFIDPIHEPDVQKLLSTSQVLVIAVDSPHLMEQDGRFHDVFNRPSVITDAIKTAFQGEGSKLLRMVLFVPVKCERYRNNGKRGSGKNMNDLLQAVRRGYGDLLTYLEANYKDSCTVAVSPCITMGGLEFLQFEKTRDRQGQELPPTSINPNNGYLQMNWRSEYVLLQDENGDHFYAPEDCAQPLLYILLFFVAVGKLREAHRNPLLKLIGFLRHLPNQNVLNAGQDALKKQLKRDESAGFAVLNDPMKAL